MAEPKSTLRLLAGLQMVTADPPSNKTQPSLEEVKGSEEHEGWKGRRNL